MSERLHEEMKTKVQILGTAALHATTACTDNANIVGSSPLNWAIVLSCML